MHHGSRQARASSPAAGRTTWWTKRRRNNPGAAPAPVRPPAVAHCPVEPSATKPASKSNGKPSGDLTPTRKLLKDIIDAGGILEIDTTDDETSYASLVGIINRRRMAPDGQEVIMIRTSYHHVVFRLSTVSDWQTQAPAETVTAERIARWHPAVAGLRTDRKLDSIGKTPRSRVFRLLHALAREAEVRGHAVRQPTVNRYGYIGGDRQLGGQLIFKVGGIDCSVSISQPTDRVDHVPTAEEVEREKRSGWAPLRYDYVPADRLKITVDTTSRFSSKQSWTETRTLPLHVRLPDVLMCFERWAVIDAEGKEAERRAEVERREREQRDEDRARQAYVQHALGERLIADVNSWELVGKLRGYLTEVSARIDAIVDDGDRAAARKWFQWCEQYAVARDPLGRPIKQPEVKAPGYSELQEFRR